MLGGSKEHRQFLKKNLLKLWGVYRSFMFVGDFLLSLGGILLRVAFLTLLERKFLGAVNFRVGPNKILLYGIFQPMADACKLFSKEFVKEKSSSVYLFFIGPFFGL
jgi:NADH-quinone oxidoreductase subunit H